MSEFEEIFCRPWSCRTMPCSWTIKTKSNGVLLGRSNEHKCPLWRVQIVPFLQRLSRLDLKEEKSHKRASSSLLFLSFHVQCLSLFRCSLQIWLTYFRCVPFSTVHDSWWNKTPLRAFIFCLLPRLTLHFSLGQDWLVTSHDSQHIYFRCCLLSQQKNRLGFWNSGHFLRICNEL